MNMKLPVLGAIALTLAPTVAVADQPNIMVIVADDMGYGDLGFTGHPKIKTPHLDALAEGGATFNHFYSPAQVCSPTRAAMLTGRMPHRHGIYSFIGGSSGSLTHLPKSEVTIPQILRKAGYQTAIIGKWHCSLNQVQQKNDISEQEPNIFNELKTQLHAAHEVYKKEAVGWKGVTPIHP